jgi:phosphoserine phosphatase
MVKPCPVETDSHFKRIKDAVSAFELKLSAEARVALKKPNLKSYLRAAALATPQIGGARTIVLSDVDGTLVKGSLVLDHAVWLHSQGSIDLGNTPAKWLADQKNELYIHELAEAYRESIRGMSVKELQANAFINELMKQENKFYSALDRLKTAYSAGHDVVLISGSPQFLVGAFARRFGFTAIGSIYHRDEERRMNGLVTGMFGAEAKQKVIEKLSLERY